MESPDRSNTSSSPDIVFAGVISSSGHSVGAPLNASGAQDDCNVIVSGHVWASNNLEANALALQTQSKALQTSVTSPPQVSSHQQPLLLKSSGGMNASKSRVKNTPRRGVVLENSGYSIAQGKNPCGTVSSSTVSTLVPCQDKTGASEATGAAVDIEESTVLFVSSSCGAPVSALVMASAANNQLNSNASFVKEASYATSSLSSPNVTAKSSSSTKVFYADTTMVYTTTNASPLMAIPSPVSTACTVSSHISSRNSVTNAKPQVPATTQKDSKLEEKLANIIKTIKVGPKSFKTLTCFSNSSSKPSRLGINGPKAETISVVDLCDVPDVENLLNPSEMSISQHHSDAQRTEASKDCAAMEARASPKLAKNSSGVNDQKKLCVAHILQRPFEVVTKSSPAPALSVPAQLPPLCSFTQSSSCSSNPRETISVKSQNELLPTPPPPEPDMFLLEKTDSRTYNNTARSEQLSYVQLHSASVTGQPNNMPLIPITIVTDASSQTHHLSADHQSLSFKQAELHSSQYLSQGVPSLVPFTSLAPASTCVSSSTTLPLSSKNAKHVETVMSTVNNMVVDVEVLNVTSGDSSLKISSSTSVAGHQSGLSRVLPEMYSSPLLLTHNGTLPAMSCSQVTSVLSALDNSQAALSQQQQQQLQLQHSVPPQNQQVFVQHVQPQPLQSLEVAQQQQPQPHASEHIHIIQPHQINLNFPHQIQNVPSLVPVANQLQERTEDIVHHKPSAENNHQWHETQSRFSEAVLATECSENEESPRESRKKRAKSERGPKKQKKKKKTNSYDTVPEADSSVGNVSDEDSVSQTDTLPKDSSFSMHSYCKDSRKKRKKKQKSDTEEENSPSKKNKKKRESGLEKITTNLVEKVACYKCKFCLFLSMSEEAVSFHVQQEHASHLPEKENSGMQCPGCTNIFFSYKSLKVHLSEDHHVADQELEDILDSYGSNESKSDSPKKKKKKHKHKEQDAVRAKNTDIGHTESENDEPLEAETQAKKKSILCNEKEMKVKKSHSSSRVSDPNPADETGKIRVRKLSSLEHPNKVTSLEIRLPSSSGNGLKTTDDPQRDLNLLTEDFSGAGNTMPPGEAGYIVNQHNNVCVEMGYCPQPLSVLEMDLEGEQQHLPQEAQDQQHIDHQHIPVQQFNLQHTDVTRNIQIVNLDSDQPLVSPSESDGQIPDDVILCEEEVLDHVLYVDDADNLSDVDDRDSPLIVCFESSSNPGTGDHSLYVNGIPYLHKLTETDSKIEDVETFIGKLDSSSMEEYEEKPNNCKRGSNRKMACAKNRKSARSKPVKVKEEPAATGYRCNIDGCSVRLHSHDKLEYHRRCHNALLVLSEMDDNSTGDQAASSKKEETVYSSRFRCPECSVNLRKWTQMCGHLWRFHSIDMELYTCEECGYKTTSLSSMINIHQLIHGRDKPFLCDTCGKGFKTPKQLRNHKVVHSNRAKAAAGKVETCGICSRSFSDARLLRSHINAVHNKMKPFMCSQCGHTAANRSSLKMHMRQHTGDRPYSCDTCSYRTSDHNSLRRHKMRHTGETPYKCPHCTYACIQSTTFKIHLRNKHPGLDNGLMFTCDKCPFHTVNGDIFLAHTAEHGTEESEGIKKGRSFSSRRLSKIAPADQLDHAVAVAAISDPIILSISTADSAHASEAPNMQGMLQNVSEAIVPGSDLHILYNNIAMNSISLPRQSNEGARSK